MPSPSVQQPATIAAERPRLPESSRSPSINPVRLVRPAGMCCSHVRALRHGGAVAPFAAESTRLKGEEALPITVSCLTVVAWVCALPQVGDGDCPPIVGIWRPGRLRRQPPRLLSVYVGPSWHGPLASSPARGCQTRTACLFGTFAQHQGATEGTGADRDEIQEEPWRALRPFGAEFCRPRGLHPATAWVTACHYWESKVVTLLRAAYLGHQAPGPPAIGLPAPRPSGPAHRPPVATPGRASLQSSHKTRTAPCWGAYRPAPVRW